MNANFLEKIFHYVSDAINSAAKYTLQREPGTKRFIRRVKRFPMRLMPVVTMVRYLRSPQVLD